MIILLISWSILLILCLIISEWLCIRGDDFFINFFLGLAVLSVYLQLWAIFLPVKYSLLPLILLIFYTLFRKRVITGYKARINEFVQQINVKGALILVVLLFIASMPVYINDDGAYYQQTIKWFSEFGFVKGLANIKVHIGLGSSWHLISSAFYFEELPFTRYYNFNGLVLFVLIISLLKSQAERFRLITLTVLFTLGALLVNAPSPDLLVLAGTVWILLNLKEVKPLHLAVIIGFLITVKVTAAGLLFFFFPVYQKPENRSRIFEVFGVLTVFAVLLIIRNIVLTGYPFFPVSTILGSGDHQVPEVFIEMFRANVIPETFDKFQLNLAAQYDLMNNYWHRFQALFLVRKYKVIMNILCIMAFTISPYLLLKRRKPMDRLMAAGIFLTGIFWFLQAPNYRFVLGFIIFMFYLVVEKWHFDPVIKYKNVLFGLCLAAIVFLNFRLQNVLYVVDCGEGKAAGPHLLMHPVPYNIIDYTSKDGFNVTDCPYCFNTPLPCYSAPVMQHYVRRFGFDVVYKNRQDIGDGFKMKKIN
jgi:hypothetical protein